MKETVFSPFLQCAWCGSDNRGGAVGYGGERSCPTCGWGGEGEPDVPCMFYKVAGRSLPQVRPAVDIIEPRRT